MGEAKGTLGMSEAINYGVLITDLVGAILNGDKGTSKASTIVSGYP